MALVFNITDTGYTPSTAFILGNYAASGRLANTLDNVNSNLVGTLSNLKVVTLYCNPFTKNFTENRYSPSTNIVIKRNNNYIPFNNSNINIIGCSELPITNIPPAGVMGGVLDTATLSISTSYYTYVPSLYTYFVPLSNRGYIVPRQSTSMEGLYNVSYTQPYTVPIRNNVYNVLPTYREYTIIL